MLAKNYIFEGLRWIALVVAIVALAVMFGGNTLSDAAFEDVSAAVLEQVDTENMTLAENQMVKRLYGLDPANFEGCVLYYPTTNMMAEEILIVKLSDVSQAEAVQQAMEARLQTQKTTFEGYGVEQFDLLSNYCVLEVRGNYALFVVSKTYTDAYGAFLDAL